MKVLADVVFRPQRHLDAAEDQLLGAVGLAAAELEEIHAEQHVAPADQVIGELGGEFLPQLVGERILRRPRHHVSRRALQHGDMRRGLGHLRHQRHGGRARADHHHALAGIVEIFGPFLRMHDLAGEVGRAGKFRRVAFLVFVIARAHEQEIAGEADDFGRALAHRALGLHGPARLRRRPRRALDAVVEADLLVDAVVDRGLAHVVQNPRPVGDRLRLGPRFERIAERIHVGVGADAGIAKQVPGAADAVAPLEDHVALARAFLLQVIARADAGQAGADDEDVEMFCCIGHDDLPAFRCNGQRREIATRNVGLPQRYRLYRNRSRAARPANKKPRIAPGLSEALVFRSGRHLQRRIQPEINTGNDPP